MSLPRKTRSVVLRFSLGNSKVFDISVTEQATEPANSVMQAWVRALTRTASIEREPLVTLPVLIDRQAAEHPDAAAIDSPEQSLSYGGLSACAARYARLGLSHGLGRGDVVCLYMQNRAEYLAIWMGLTRIGASVALINSNLVGDALAHCVRIVEPRWVIVGADLAANYLAVRGKLGPGLTAWVHGDATGDLAPLGPTVAALDGSPLADTECALPSIDDRALFIYTSGTTGLPKAANVTHYRLMQWSQWFAGMMNVVPTDRMYNCLPLYHSVGGVVAMGATLVGGGSVVLRPRFSASEFWRDVRTERCTLFQYIGELCRYLVNTPSQPDEARHQLRIACGNGLRPEVWTTFRDRFAIPRILEYYASTEGNFSLYNCEGEPGAIGRIPPFLAQKLPVALLKFDVETGEPWRNDAGFCERCGPNEVGEAVGLIPGQQRGRTGRFEGYADEAASRRKQLDNVFKPGDCWYRTGDLMRRDERGFYYFVDRVGETYRWKGENVSTAEVLSVLTGLAGVRDGVVYGVTVPGADGRAGMAALVVDSDFDLDAFRAEVAARLPVYARPVFLRLLPALEATGTFKPKKQELVSAGFDPQRVPDPLYVDDAKGRRYVAIDADLYGHLVEGRVRL